MSSVSNRCKPSRLSQVSIQIATRSQLGSSLAWIQLACITCRFRMPPLGTTLNNTVAATWYHNHLVPPPPPPPQPKALPPVPHFKAMPDSVRRQRQEAMGRHPTGAQNGGGHGAAFDSVGPSAVPILTQIADATNVDSIEPSTQSGASSMDATFLPEASGTHPSSQSGASSSDATPPPEAPGTQPSSQSGASSTGAASLGEAGGSG
jgi:hypothetical protein